MKGDPQIIEVLNECLTAELTAQQRGLDGATQQISPSSFMQ